MLSVPHSYSPQQRVYEQCVYDVDQLDCDKSFVVFTNYNAICVILKYCFHKI